jgi:hypothetical protein
LQQQLGELLVGVGEVQALAGPGVELVGDGVELGFSDGGEVGALEEVLAQKPVGVLVEPRCQGACGSQKKTSMPASMCTCFQSRISGPWSQVSERRSASGSVCTLAASAGATCSGR